METCVLKDGCGVVVEEFATRPTDAEVQAVFDADMCLYGIFALVCETPAGCCTNGFVKHFTVPMNKNVLVCNGTPVICDGECVVCIP